MVYIKMYPWQEVEQRYMVYVYIPMVSFDLWCECVTLDVATSV